MSNDELYDLLMGDDAQRNRAFSYIIRAQRDMFIQHACMRGGTRQSAEDAFQEALLALYKWVLTGRLSRSDRVLAFVFAVARNKWRDDLNRWGKMVGADEEDLIYLIQMQTRFPEKLPMQEDMELILLRIANALKTHGHPVLIDYFIRHRNDSDIRKCYGYKSVDSTRVIITNAKKRWLKWLNGDTGAKDLISGMMSEIILMRRRLEDGDWNELLKVLPDPCGEKLKQRL